MEIPTTETSAYVPQDAIEKGYFDYLWEVANNRTPGSAPIGSGELSGIAAVTFFQRSGVDKGFLKQIWSLSTPSATMNLSQFYSALRFITLIQNGEMPISKEKLQQTSKEKIGLPKFGGVELPIAAPQSSQSGGVSINPAAFAITPQEHLKYHTLFLQYDTNKDGYLSREECLPVFKQSGLDAQSVELIWNCADDDRDNKLTSKEFCTAFHIIVCVSKRFQPVPTTLPVSLRSFLANAPVVPADVVLPVVPQQPHVSSVNSNLAPPSATIIPTSSLPAVAPVQSAPPVPAQLKTVSAAFDDLDADASSVSNITPIPPAKLLSAPAPSTTVSPSDEQDLYNSVDGMKTASKKAMQVHEGALDINTKALSNLLGIKQRLATERISLEAFVANGSVANQELSNKLELTCQEIALLQAESVRLKQLNDNLINQKVDFHEKLSQAQQEKRKLHEEIAELLSQVQQNGQDNFQLTQQVLVLQSQYSDTIRENAVHQQSLLDIQKETQEKQKDVSQLKAFSLSLQNELNRSKSVTLSTQDTIHRLNSLLVVEQKKSNALQQQLQKEGSRCNVLEQEKIELLSRISALLLAQQQQQQPSPSVSDRTIDEVPAETMSLLASNKVVFDGNHEELTTFEQLTDLPVTAAGASISINANDGEIDPFGAFGDDVAGEEEVFSASATEFGFAPLEEVALPTTDDAFFAQSATTDPFASTITTTDIFCAPSNSVQDDPFAAFSSADPFGEETTSHSHDADNVHHKEQKVSVVETTLTENISGESAIVADSAVVDNGGFEAFDFESVVLPPAPTDSVAAGESAGADSFTATLDVFEEIAPNVISVIADSSAAEKTDDPFDAFHDSTAPTTGTNTSVPSAPSNDPFAEDLSFQQVAESPDTTNVTTSVTPIPAVLSPNSFDAFSSPTVEAEVASVVDNDPFQTNSGASVGDGDFAGFDAFEEFGNATAAPLAADPSSTVDLPAAPSDPFGNFDNSSFSTGTIHAEVTSFDAFTPTVTKETNSSDDPFFANAALNPDPQAITPDEDPFASSLVPSSDPFGDFDDFPSSNQPAQTLTVFSDSAAPSSTVIAVEEEDDPFAGFQ